MNVQTIQQNSVRVQKILKYFFNNPIDNKARF